jgi:hypothetical protein
VPNPVINRPNVVLLHPEPAYRRIEGVWQDYWYYREKTSEELAQEKEAVLKILRDRWTNRAYAHNFTAWVLNEEMLRYEPPFTVGTAQVIIGAKSNPFRKTANATRLTSITG